MALKLFEFLEQLMIETFFFTKSTQFEKTGLMNTVFLRLGNLKNKIHSRH